MDGFSDLVVVIPGILGSRLVRRFGPHREKKEVVWDFSIRNLPTTLRAVVSQGLVLDPWSKPGDDDVEAEALFSFQVLPGFFGVDDYDRLLIELGAVVGPDQVIPYPYDWRRSNAYAAEGLARLIGERLPAWRKQSGATKAKVWLVAHSMGGLVARYYCEELGGAVDTRGVITMGTPHRGSVNALEGLANGKRYGPLDLTPLVRSLPSMYELLPLFPVLMDDTGDPVLRRLGEVFGFDAVTGEASGEPPSLAKEMAFSGLVPSRVQAALRFHAKIRQPAQARVVDDETSAFSAPYQQRAIFNRRQYTSQAVALDGPRLEILKTDPKVTRGKTWDQHDERGDGTVPSMAAVPVEWATTAEAVANAEKHTAIQTTDDALDCVANWLRPKDVKNYRGSEPTDAQVVVLTCPDVVSTRDGELTVNVSTGAPTNAYVDLVHVDSGKRVSRPVAITEELSPLTFSLVEPAEGVYRVLVRPLKPGRRGVTDYTLVLEP